MSLSICKICTLTANDNLCTSLGASPICTECFVKRAETPRDLHEAAASAKRSKRALPPEIKANMTVWIGDGVYLPLAEWYRQAMQMPVVMSPDVEDIEDEEEELLASVMQKIMDIADQEAFEASLPKLRPRKPSLYSRAKDRIKSVFAVACDIKYHASI